ncbi:MAG: hypothetical protein HYY31_05440 [Chloroflexi bacterium]|nr:hypothetical protein [Chloroflexota bacterium]
MGWLAKRLATGQRGSGLLETVIALAFAATGVTAMVGLGAIGAIAGGTSNDRNVASILARSQIESLLSGPYRLAGDYPSISFEGFVVEVLTEDVAPGLLQKVTVRIRSGKGRDSDRILAEIESYKSNRYLSGGERPAPGGMEFLKSIDIPTLNGKTGAYFVVDVIPSAVLSTISGRWEITKDPAKPFSSERQDLSITIYQGTPFGEGSEVSSTAPEDVAGYTVIGVGKTKDVSMEVSARGQWSGKYTVYFFNETQGKRIATVAASLSCICP